MRSIDQEAGLARGQELQQASYSLERSKIEQGRLPPEHAHRPLLSLADHLAHMRTLWRCRGLAQRAGQICKQPRRSLQCKRGTQQMEQMQEYQAACRPTELAIQICPPYSSPSSLAWVARDHLKILFAAPSYSCSRPFWRQCPPPSQAG